MATPLSRMALGTVVLAPVGAHVLGSILLTARRETQVSGGLYQELKRRKVFGSTIAYAVVGFALIEGADIIVPNLGLSQAWVQFAVWVVIGGFPIALALSWTYDFSRGSLERTPDVREVVTSGSERVAASLVENGTRTPGTSIAVLSFVDMSADKDQEYLCDGIAEEILDTLARVEGLSVAARTSGFAYKGTNQDVREIGQELGVEAVLEGSVRKSGDRIRIVAQLVSADDGYHFWSEKYDSDLEDIFQIQEDIAGAVVDRLRDALGFEGESPRIRGHTSNPQAYELYLQGRFYWARRHQVGFEKAIGCFKQALELDPTYSLAHSGLADAFSFMGFYRMVGATQARQLVGQSVGLALQFAPDQAATLRSLAHKQLWWDYDFQGGVETLERAVQITPNDAETHLFHAQALIAVGRYDEADEAIQRGYSLDPASVAIVALAGSNTLWNRDFYRAVDLLDKAIAMDPTLLLARFNKGMALLALGTPEVALEDLELAAEMSQRNPVVLGLLAEALAMACRSEDAWALINELKELDDEVRPEAFIGIVLMVLDDVAGAGAAMERAVGSKEPGLLMIGKNAFADPLRTHPRYDEWIERIGLPKYDP